MADIEQKIKIDYETNAEATAKKVDVLVDAQDNSAQATTKATKSTNNQREALGELAPALDNTIKGIQATTRSLFLLIANPVGAFLALLVGAVALLGKAFFSTEENGNKFSKGLAVISGLFSGLLKVLEPVASFLIDKIVKGFEFAGNAVLATSALLQKALRAIGFEAAANGLNALTNAVTENVKASNDLADAEAKLQVMQRASQRIQLEYQKTAEKIRQQRDDESNSIAERVRLNEKLGAVLKDQLRAELSIANQQLKVSDLRIKQEGKSSANLDEREAALTRIADIQERLSGQESEQLANANSLRNEQKNLDKEALAAKKARLEAEKKLEQEKRDAELKALKELDEANKLRDKELREVDDKKRKEQNEREQEDGRLALEQAKYFSDERIRIAEVEAQHQKEIEALKRDVLMSGLDLVKSLFEKNKKIQKAVLITQGIIGLTDVTRDTIRGVSAELAKGVAGIPGAVLIGAKGAINAASIIASTAKGLKALGGGGSVGSPDGATSAGGSGAVPQVAFQNSSENQIANSVNQSQQNLQVTVLESDISKAQNNVKVLVNENSF